MKSIRKLATTNVASFSLMVLLAAPVSSQSLSASDMAFAFGGKAAASEAAQQAARPSTPKAAEPITIASARGMTQAEMQETEGAWGPASVIGGAIGGGGYLLTTPRSDWSWGGFGGNTALGAATAGGSALALRGTSMAAGSWATSRGIGVQGNGWRAAYHGPHHNFGVIGRQPHFQLNTWTPGVRNSGRTYRLPW